MGSGPGPLNAALKRNSADDGKPAIDTDETMMFNLGVDEPGTYSAYAVQLAETGIAGLLCLLACLAVPLVLVFRGGTALRARANVAAAGSLLSLVIIDVFHSNIL